MPEEFASNRVQNQVHAPAFGDSLDPRRKCRVSGVEDVILGDPIPFHQQLLLRDGANRGEDLYAKVLADLNSSLADTASGRVDQDGLALAHPSQVNEANPRCREGDGDRRSFLD